MKRYNSFVGYFKEKYGCRLQKIVVDAGFTCPNRDGKVGFGGCTYCNNDAFHPNYSTPDKSIFQQLEEGIEFHMNRYRKTEEYLAYFQSYSNTYAPLEHLKDLYAQALAHPKVRGIAIGTRPDCIDSGKLDYLQQLSKDYYITVEYGIESCYDKTLKTINRGHDFQTTVDAIKATAERGLHVGGHLIFGLPGESREEMLAQAHTLSALPLHSLKFHQLQILKGSLMEKDYALHPDKYSFFEIDDYIDFVIDFLEHLRPDIVVERFAGEVPPRFQVTSAWGMIRNEKIPVLVENRMKQRDTWQGKYF